MLRQPDLSHINKILLFIVLLGVVLYFGREVFIVIIFSGFLAMLMTPFSSRMENAGISRVFSSLISVLIIVAVIAGIIVLLSSQIAAMSDDFPQMKERIEEGLFNVEQWINNTIGISSDTLESKASDMLSNAGGIITGAVKSTFSFFGSSLLIIVFTFLFLLHREKYENFVVMLSREEKRDETRKVIGKISRIAQQYLGGRLISIIILGILYLTGFTIIGLKNALLLSGLAAIMTFIPYIGPVLGGFIPFFIAIVNGSFNQALWVIVIISLAQLFDNYFIEPYVVGGSVSINPFFTIFILIMGGVVWGIAGVILFLPLLGIFRIIFENVESLQPYAYLIGDDKKSSGPHELLNRITKLFSSRKTN
ncbi:MAG TPA: AI-2E family transporter [Bacteroidales bacterium]|nr:AI-2E family transporter [Bacteroidales bacterium]